LLKKKKIQNINYVMNNYIIITNENTCKIPTRDKT